MIPTAREMIWVFTVGHFPFLNLSLDFIAVQIKLGIIGIVGAQFPPEAEVLLRHDIAPDISGLDKSLPTGRQEAPTILFYFVGVAFMRPAS